VTGSVTGIQIVVSKKCEGGQSTAGRATWTTLAAEKELKGRNSERKLRETQKRQRKKGLNE